MDNMGLQFGLMNSLGRLAGDRPVLSVLLCTLVPGLINAAPRLVSRLLGLLSRYLTFLTVKYYIRRIVFHTGDNMNVQMGRFGPVSAGSKMHGFPHACAKEHASLGGGRRATVCKL